MRLSEGKSVYVWTAVALGALTLAGLALVFGARLAAGVLVGVLAALAVAQVLLQAVYFMHLNVSRRAFAVLFGAGLAAAVVLAWSLSYLVRRM